MLIATRSINRCGRRLRQILSDRARRHAKTEFQQQLVCDSLLAPRRVLARQPANQMLEVRWNPLPAGLAFPTPKKLEALAMPADKGFGRHDRQSVSPVEP